MPGAGSTAGPHLAECEGTTVVVGISGNQWRGPNAGSITSILATVVLSGFISLPLETSLLTWIYTAFGSEGVV